MTELDSQALEILWANLWDLYGDCVWLPAQMPRRRAAKGRRKHVRLLKAAKRRGATL